MSENNYSNHFIELLHKKPSEYPFKDKFAKSNRFSPNTITKISKDDEVALTFLGRI